MRRACRLRSVGTVSAGQILALAVLPSTFLQAATCYVSKDGNNEWPGTKERPWRTVQKAAGSIQPGDTVMIMPGIYRARKFRFQPPGRDVDHRTVFKFANADNSAGRAVLTGRDGECPSFQMEPNTRIEGLWIGGELRDKEPKGFINREGLQVIGCTFWVRESPKREVGARGNENNFELLTGNAGRNILFQNNLLVHMGGNWFHHPIYISGGPPPPTTQDCRFIGNTFINGGGFALHCWHQPKNITIVANFTSGHMGSLAAQGPGHVIHHNVFWRPVGRADHRDWDWNALLPNPVIRFDHNILGSPHPIREGGKPQQPPVHNYSLAGVKGTQVNLIPLPPVYLPQIPWVRQSPAQIEAAIRYVDRYFSTQSAEQMVEDRSDTLERALRILRVKYQPTRKDLASRPVK